ncbi:hypothetical protein TNCV_253791 [Trichonephila clavipes]|nr:hypothetical protein TNCV_253791 [Trichonephila clavipes]
MSGTEVHGHMFRSGHKSDVKDPVFSSQASLELFYRLTKGIKVHTTPGYAKYQITELIVEKITSLSKQCSPKFRYRCWTWLNGRNSLAKHDPRMLCWLQARSNLEPRKIFDKQSYITVTVQFNDAALEVMSLKDFRMHVNNVIFATHIPYIPLFYTILIVTYSRYHLVASCTLQIIVKAEKGISVERTTHAQSVEEERAEANLCARNYPIRNHDGSLYIQCGCSMEAQAVLSGVNGHMRLVVPALMSAFYGEKVTPRQMVGSWCCLFSSASYCGEEGRNGHLYTHMNEKLYAIGHSPVSHIGQAGLQLIYQTVSSFTRAISSN